MTKLIYTQEELAQGSEEWLQFRSHGLGGSEVASLMHENPYETLVETWEKKVFPKGERSEELAEHMRRGNELEPKARLCYEAISGRRVEQLCLLHPEHTWMRTSLDGITLDRHAVLEIKCPKNLENHRRQITPTKGSRLYRGISQEVREGKFITTEGEFTIPPYRYAQMQHQLAVCNAHFGTREVHYFSYFDDNNFAWIVVPIDEAYIEELIRREQIFYQQFVLPKVQPPPYLFKEEPRCERREYV